MKKLLSLIKINFHTFFDLNLKRQNKKKNIPLILLYLYSFTIIAIFSYNGSSGMLKILKPLNLESIFLVGLMAVLSIYTFTITIFKVNKTLYNSKDYQILFSFPIKKELILSSKILMLYIGNLIFSSIIIIPAYIAYLVKIDTTILFNILYLLSIPIIPIIPTIIGSLVGGVITSLSSNFKFKNLTEMILSLGIIVSSFFLSYKSQSLSSIELTNLNQGLIDKFAKIYPPTKIYNNIISNLSILNLFLYLLISIFIYQIFKYILAKHFDKVHSKLNTVKINKKQKKIKIKNNNKLKSLYLKEVKRYITLPMYVLNTIVGSAMLLITLGIFLYSGEEVTSEIIGIPNIGSYFTLYGSLLFSIFMGLSCTTSASLSLEGKNIWNIKSLPIEPKDIFKSKILLNLTITIPAILIGATAIFYIIKLSFMEYLLFIFPPVMFSFLISGIGLLINLLYPSFEWVNETKVIKQSAPVFLTMALGFALSITPLLIKTNINKYLYIFIIGVIYLLLSIIIYNILFKRGKNIFKKL